MSDFKEEVKNGIAELGKMAGDAANRANEFINSDKAKELTAKAEEGLKSVGEGFKEGFTELKNEFNKATDKPNKTDKK